MPGKLHLNALHQGVFRCAPVPFPQKGAHRLPQGPAIAVAFPPGAGGLHQVQNFGEGLFEIVRKPQAVQGKALIRKSQGKICHICPEGQSFIWGVPGGHTVTDPGKKGYRPSPRRSSPLPDRLRITSQRAVPVQAAIVHHRAQGDAQHGQHALFPLSWKKYSLKSRFCPEILRKYHGNSSGNMVQYFQRNTPRRG